MMEKSTIKIISPTPVLNTAEFRAAFGGKSGCHIPKTSSHHPIHYEFVALPGMTFTIKSLISRHHHCIYAVKSSFYPSDSLFLDSRFTRATPHDRFNPPPLPTRDALAKKMHSLLGTSYVWGGNWSAGIPQLLHLYPPHGAIDELTKTLWTLKGVDCSGLLYEATGGATPRNTKDLIHFGRSIRIKGHSAEQIAQQLLPMDMVVWPGHVWFILDSQFSIESRSPCGVVERPLHERLEETLRERSGEDEWSSQLDPKTHFVIRRFLS